MEFDSSLNVIVGPSDQGKSAIIRALKWALYNEPSGDFYKGRRKECSVTIIFSDNTKIKDIEVKAKIHIIYMINMERKKFLKVLELKFLRKL